VTRFFVMSPHARITGGPDEYVADAVNVSPPGVLVLLKQRVDDSGDTEELFEPVRMFAPNMWSEVWREDT
jgi:hypothetical protein